MGSCCLFFSFLCCVMCTIVCLFVFFCFSHGVVSLFSIYEVDCPSGIFRPSFNWKASRLKYIRTSDMCYRIHVFFFLFQTWIYVTVNSSCFCYSVLCAGLFNLTCSLSLMCTWLACRTLLLYCLFVNFAVPNALAFI